MGGHLTKLRRTLVSPFGLAECQSWEAAELIPTATGISRILPIRELDAGELTEISFGRPIAANVGVGPVAALADNGGFVALLENRIIGEKVSAFPTLVSMKEFGL